MDSGVWDLDNGDSNPLRIPVQVGDFIPAHEGLGPWSIAASEYTAPPKPGDRLFGFIAVSCPTCKRTKAYWVYAVNGSVAWYSEVKTGYPDVSRIFLKLGDIRNNPDAFFPTSSNRIGCNRPLDQTTRIRRLS